MLSLIAESNDPFLNLATEEYLLHERNEDFLVLTINSPCVVVGKHQAAHREVNARFTEDMSIPVLRRISGGGTVYHDFGNLNFAFIRQSEPGKQVDFRYYTRPVIDFLETLGIKAVFEGKNDLRVDGLKISGNAEHVYKNRVLHHGTLLFDASLENMRNSLRPLSDHYSTRAVESNRSSVTNLKERLNNIDTTEQLREAMLEYFRNYFSGMQNLHFTGEETEKISILAGDKYKSWDWTWGYGPPYTFTSMFRIAGINCRCRLHVKDGIIWESDIEGSLELSLAGKMLIGCRHMHEDIRNVLKSCNIHATDDEIYQFF